MAASPCKQVEDEYILLKNQLSVARSEINNLRQQIKSLTFAHHKDVQRIQETLKSWKCHECQSKSAEGAPSRFLPEKKQQEPSDTCEKPLSLQPIGIVSTWFPQKRGTPRQPGVCKQSQGVLKIFNHVFTNPEHSLEGIELFSHMWILFYFHKNESTHCRAKVTPPRLNGSRVGLFGTRSPHRPSPIGLSLVKIDKVDGSSVYFSGVDMVDGTPVLDIKPYIPEYDCPSGFNSSDCGLEEVTVGRMMDGRELEDREKAMNTLGVNLESQLKHSSSESLSNSNVALGFECEREAPDGEEDGINSAGQASAVNSNNLSVSPSPSPGIDEELGRLAPDNVTVPLWISKPPLPKLSVEFSGRAEGQLKELTRLNVVDGDGHENDTAGIPCENTLKRAIESVLSEDPRSIYVREKWVGQTYTFLIHNFHVRCKFDDNTRTVTVSQIRSSNRKCECDLLEWQCRIHGYE
ncbi:tRNA (adenine(37)-N6)-methyltransferase [Ischnura elegans]|uniref:tRNA (adenine(37)-N6)-methyltransferase n=1 Tax=Ischnura elegans TaxID=197161 RepID=UPI001ED8A6C8|nr:tRNA (adenine(37)-N6)-methyltransferase [Ischnura elegans]